MKRAAPGTFPTYKAAKKQFRKTDKSPKRRAVPQSQKLESKHFDTALAFTIDATAEIPATGQLCFVQTGDTLTNRDGAVIQVTSLQLRGTAIAVPAAAANLATVAYLYVILDRMANGAVATVTGTPRTDILTGANITTAMGFVPNQHRFKVLKKIRLIFNAQAGVTTAYGSVVAAFDEFLAFKKPIEIRFNASTGAITDISSANIFLIAGTDGYSDDIITVDGNARIRFTG